MNANQNSRTMAKTNRRALTAEEQEARDNLRRIWNEKKSELRITQESAAHKMDISQGAVSHYLNGIIPLNMGAIFKFSELLKVNPNEISRDLVPHIYAMGGGKTIEFEQIIQEAKAGMNTAANLDGAEMRHKINKIRSVPVLNKSEIINGFDENSTAKREFAPAVECSPKAFAFSASEIPNPNDRFGIEPSTLIIIDPESEWVNGKLLLLKDINDNLIIRRYEVVGSMRYLAPYNERYDPVELNQDFVVIGKVMGRYHQD